MQYRQSSYKKTKWILLLLSFSSLSSHARIITQEQNSLPLTAIDVTFRVGSADDLQGKEGLANITAELVRNGGVLAWKKQPAKTRQDLEAALYPMAAEIKTVVEKEQTSFSVTATPADAPKVLKILSQMILAPALDPKEFARIKTEILDFLTLQFPHEDQEEFGKAVLDLAIYGKGHPYAHPVVGLTSSLKTITVEDVATFLKTFYSQKRLVVGLGGKVSAELRSLAEEFQSKLPTGTTNSAKIPAPSKSDHLKILIVEGPFDGTGVHFGLPLEANRKGSSFPSLFLFSTAFGKHRSFVGRLMQIVREKRGLNYGTYAYIEDFPHGGQLLTEPLHVSRQIQSFTVWGRPTPHDNGCFLTRMLYKEIQSVVQNGISEEEYANTKSHLHT